MGNIEVYSAKLWQCVVLRLLRTARERREVCERRPNGQSFPLAVLPDNRISQRQRIYFGLAVSTIFAGGLAPLLWDLLCEKADHRSNLQRLTGEMGDRDGLPPRGHHRTQQCSVDMLCQLTELPACSAIFNVATECLLSITR